MPRLANALAFVGLLSASFFFFTNFQQQTYSMLDLSPAHLHLALNHIPIIGLAVASFPIVIGILAQCRTTIATGLLATLLCAAAMPTIMETGHNASHAFKTGVTTPGLDEAGKEALHLHATRAAKTTPVIYASALLALLALLALIKFPKPATWLAFAVLLGNAIAILLAISTADAGGKIRHTEFRAQLPAVIAPVENSVPTASPTATPAATPGLLAIPTATPVATPMASPELGVKAG